VASLIPISRAIVRVLQCVAFAGAHWVVLWITSSFTETGMAGLRPRREASFSSPDKPNFKNRLRQRATL
jgi:hypothetical protein